MKNKNAGTETRPMETDVVPLALHHAAHRQRWCAKRSLALLAGCKSRPGKA